MPLVTMTSDLSRKDITQYDGSTTTYDRTQSSLSSLTVTNYMSGVAGQ